jgi:hypothetical protein
MKKFAIVAAVALLAASSQALIFDVEPTNNTRAGGTLIGGTVPWAESSPRCRPMADRHHLSNG